MNPIDALNAALNAGPNVQAAWILLQQKEAMKARYGFLSNIDEEAREITLKGIGLHLHQRHLLVSPSYWSELTAAMLSDINHADTRQAPAETPTETAGPRHQPADQEAPTAPQDPTALQALTDTTTPEQWNSPVSVTQQFGHPDPRYSDPFGQTEPTELISAEQLLGTTAPDETLSHEQQLHKIKAHLETLHSTQTLSQVARDIDEARNTLVRLLDPQHRPSPAVIQRVYAKLYPSAEQISHLAREAQVIYSIPALLNLLRRNGLSNTEAQNAARGRPIENPDEIQLAHNLLRPVAEQGRAVAARCASLLNRINAITDGQISRQLLATVLAQNNHGLTTGIFERLRDPRNINPEQLKRLEQALDNLTEEQIQTVAQNSYERVSDARHPNHIARHALEETRKLIATLSNDHRLRLVHYVTRTADSELERGLDLLLKGRTFDGNRLALTPKQASQLSMAAETLLSGNNP